MSTWEFNNQDRKYISQLYVIPAVDAVEAGKGQLEISVNQGKVPNNVQMQGAGRCLVTFIPQHPGTYVIDVTFNGHQVHGCPIRVEVHTKQVGKQVTAPFSPTSIIPTGGAGIAGSPPPRPASSDRSYQTSPIGPPRVDTSYSVTSTSSSRNIESPRSPTLLRHIRRPSSEQHSPQPTYREDQYPRSARLIREHVSPPPEKRERTEVGFTVAQYGEPRTGSPVRGASISPRAPDQSIPQRYFEESDLRGKNDVGVIKTTYAQPRRPYETDEREPLPRATDSGFADVSHGSTSYDRFSPQSASTPKPHKYFEAERHADPEQTRFELHRTREVNLYKEHDGTTHTRTADISTFATSGPDVRQESGMDYTSTSKTIPPTRFQPIDTRDVAEEKRYYERRDSPPRRYESPERYERPPSPPRFPPHVETSRKEEAHVTVPIKKSHELQETPLEGLAWSSAQYMRDRVPEEIQPTSLTDHRKTEVTHTPSERQHYKEYDTHEIEQPPELPKTAPPVEDQWQARPRETHEVTTEIYDRQEPHDKLTKASELQEAPLDEYAWRTAHYMRVKEEDDKILEKHGYGAAESRDQPDHALERRSSLGERHEAVEQFPSDISALTPKTRKKLFEHNIQRAPDLKEDERYTSESAVDIGEDRTPEPGSKQSSKPTTPKLSLKFGKDKKAAAEGGGGFEFGKSKFTSKHEVVKRGKDVEVKVDSLKLGKEDQLKVVVMPPSSRGREQLSPAEVPNKVKKSRNNYEISFKPTEVGTHKVMVFVNDEPHPLAPFPIRVYDAAEIIVGDIVKESIINDIVEFTVDAGRAGFGNLEMAIKDSDSVIIPSNVSQLESGSAKFLVTFQPTSLGTHTVNITFNKEVLKGSPFEVNIVENLTPAAAVVDAATTDSKKAGKEKSKDKEKKEKKEKEKKEKEKLAAEKLSQAKEKSSHKLQVNKIPSLSRVDKPASLLINLPPGESGVIDATVVDPNKRSLPVDVFDEEPNVKRVEFTPSRVGDHEITVKFAGKEVSGSPFTCRAYDPAKINVGPIPNGVLNKPVHFVVDASEAGVGNLEVAVNEGRIPSMAHALGNHKYDISFVPRDNIDHSISVRFNNEPVTGSPFLSRLVASSVQVAASGLGLERVAVNKPVEFYIVVDAADQRNIATPQVEIIDPRGAQLPQKISRDPHDPTQFIVEYTPVVVGNHQIDIRHENELIPGSPFTSKAFDASQAVLTLAEAAQVGKPCTFTIDAAKAGAGNMEIIVSVENRNVPNFVQAEGQAKFKVSFTPQEAKDHMISVKFNGIPIPGSPMRCPVPSGPVGSPTPISSIQTTALGAMHERAKSSEEIRLVGDLATAQVGKPKGFSIDAPKRNTECNVIVTGPNKKRVPVELVRVDEGFDVEFLPKLKGEYEIDILLDGKSLSVCPIICRATDKVAISEFVNIPERVTCGEKINFDVNLGRIAKKDEIRVEVCGEDGTLVPIQTNTDRNAGVVHVSCTIAQAGDYFVDVFRNHSSVGERINFTATPPTGAGIDDGSGIRFAYFPSKALVDRPAHFELEIQNGLENEIHLEILDAERNSVPVSLTRLENSVFVADWLPKSEGPHVVTVKMNRRAIAGTPLTVNVLDLSAVRVIGLRNDSVGVQQRFNLDWSNSGGSNVTVSISHEDGEPIKYTLKKVKHGLHVCTFTPKRPGAYLIDVYVDEIALPECPYECYISDVGAVRARGDALYRAQRGKTARFEVSLGNSTGRGDLDVLVTDSLRGPLPVRCYKQHDDSYWVEFTPEQVGAHNIEVTFAEVPVAGSPFKCEVVDPKRVTIRGGDDPLILRQIANITINRRLAGSGELAIELTDPQGIPLKVDQIKTSIGDDNISFLPVKLGPHKLNLKLAGFQVPGTPKTITVEEQGRPSLYGAALDYAVERDQQASMIFDPKKLKGGIKIDVRGPDGEKVRYATNKRPDGSSEISFRPVQVGIYKVNVDFNNKPIHGSPFPVSVIDSKKVLVNDENVGADGALRLTLNQRNYIDIDTTAAGPGKLRGEIRDSEGELLSDAITVENLGYGKHRVIVTPKQSGSYKIYLYWAEQVVPNAYPLLAIAGSHERSREPFSAHDRLQQAQTSRDLVTGDDLKRVVLRGDGLKRAMIREQAEFTIDASEAPKGQLSAQCVGPTKLAYCELYDHRDGTYLLSVRPTELGKHTLVIKYSNEHVPGSPFVFNVSNPPDPTKVKVYGPGIEHGILHSFKSNFIVETTGAGAGQLTVRVRGPKAAFNVEMQRDRNHDRTIHCKYEPREPGDYQVEVKWHGQHVPGSPFLVMIVDTEQELQRFLAGEAPSPQPATPFIPPGWVGPPPPPPPMIASPYPIPLGAPPPHAIMAAGGRRAMPIRGPPPPAMMTAASYGKPSRQHREF
uniref:Uncharacterized protein n=1 Tax=Acrobeloides nanus TaxID=290746 RepID=A0A914BW54_9BILA